ncbi:MAG TPA: hypothetical protein VHR35_15570 [Nocardioides sp.]|jgi:hypothetical protein|nr:hypothetical protein [Nocardioides sp.]
MRTATAARGLVGGACVLAPWALLATVGGPDRDDPRVAAVARVLGARLLLQAALDVAKGRRTRHLDAAVELSHAASMLPVAALWPLHRRSALVSAAVATGIAVLDLAGL